MDFGKAFSYPLQDKKKIIQGGLIILIPFFGMVSFFGYALEAIRNVAAGDDEVLPSWDNFGEYFVHGLISGIAGLIYFLPVIAIGFGLADYLIGYFLAAIVGIPLGLIYMVAVIRYATEDSVFAFIDVGKNVTLTINNVKSFVVIYAVIFILHIVAILGSYIVAITICGPLFLLAYIWLVDSYLIGNIAKDIEELVPQKDPIFLSTANAQQQMIEKNVLPTPESELDKLQDGNSESTTRAAIPFENNVHNSVIYTISVPKNSKFEPEKAESLIKQVLTQIQDIVFTIIAENKTIRWEIWDIRQAYNPQLIIQAIKSVYPESQVKVTDFKYPEFDNPFWRQTIIYQQYEYFVTPIKYVTELKKVDPLVQFVQGMSELNEGERIVHFIYVPSMIGDQERNAAFKKITRSGWQPSLDLGSLEGAVGSVIGSSVSAMFSGRVAKFDPEYQKIYEERLHSHLLFNCFIMTQIDVIERPRISKLSGLHSSMFQFHGEENVIALSEELTPPEPFYVEDRDMDRSSSALGKLEGWISGINTKHQKAKAILATLEIASLWHLPYEEFTTPEIDWQDVAVPSKELLENKAGVIIGNSTIAGANFPVRIHPNDRTTHMNIIGRTGVGKSTFMHNLIHQDILDGKGVGVIDPHGQLIQDILRISIPDERIDDVCVIDIANENYPPPLNPLLGNVGDESYTASEIVNILDKSEKMGLPERVTDTLTAALVTLRHEPTPTVRDVVKLFENAEYRHQVLNRVLGQIIDVTTHEFWEKFEHQSLGMQENLTYPVIHRMRKFYRNPILHPMMCHPDRFDFSDAIRQKKIVLVSLGIDQRKVPELERELVGLIIMSQMQMAGMASLANPCPFFLYVDEVQNFVTSPLNKVFEEARKYELHLTVANQYLGQLIGKTLESVMGTVGATVVFQIGEKDAYILSPYFRPIFTNEDLVNQDLYQAAIKTRFKGKNISAFTITTNDTPGNTNTIEAIEREKMIRQRSIELYTPKTKTEVLEWLNNRYPPPTFPTDLNQSQGFPKSEDWIDKS